MANRLEGVLPKSKTNNQKSEMVLKKMSVKAKELIKNPKKQKIQKDR